MSTSSNSEISEHTADASACRRPASNRYPSACSLSNRSQLGISSASAPSDPETDGVHAHRPHPGGVHAPPERADPAAVGALPRLPFAGDGDPLAPVLGLVLRLAGVVAQFLAPGGFLQRLRPYD